MPTNNANCAVDVCTARVGSTFAIATLRRFVFLAGVCSVACVARPQSAFPESFLAVSQLVAFIVADDSDCAGAVFAADMLAWPSVRPLISIGAVIVRGTSSTQFNDASRAAKDFGGAARRPLSTETAVVNAVLREGKAMLVIVDKHSFIVLISRLTHDVRSKRAFVAWLHATTLERN